MDNDKHDLRIVKTEYLLSKALFDLLKSNLFSNITVNDICNEAMVSRSAFYDHFNDKYHLLRSGLDTINMDFKSQLVGRPLREYIHIMLVHIMTNDSIFKNIVKSGLNKELLEIILQPHMSNIEKAMTYYLRNNTYNKNAASLSVPPQTVAFYHASGIVITIFMWIEQNMDYSVEEMTDYLVSLLPSTIRDITIIPELN